MKKIIAIVLAAGAIGSAAAQPSVGVSIGINQPGVYGRINIGDVPRPALILPQPVLITRPRVAVQRDPVYLYVPPTHQQNWRQYCGRYEACGQPVYFVRDQWVRERYEREHPGWNRGKHRGWDKHDKRGKHDDRGHGNGHGKGHGRD
ncbi:MAG: hypothetical protein V4750_15310 [Pseudomonadota bacterium]